MIAGFLEPDGGELRIKGRSMRGVPANKRDLGMVFQTYSPSEFIWVHELTRRTALLAGILERI